MRFKRRMQFERGLQQIDIAPMINMLFLLLIFFMLTSSFVIKPGIRVGLPRAVTSEAVSQENLEIIISAENTAYLNGAAVTSAELKSVLKRVSKRGVTVLIKADRRASLGRAVEIWDLCRDLGVTQVNIATNQD